MWKHSIENFPSIAYDKFGKLVTAWTDKVV